MAEAHSYRKGVGGFDQTFGLPMRRFVPTLVRLAGLTPGQRVLDFATGTGIAAEAALAAVGPSGHVTAPDDTPAMLEQARARLSGRSNVAFAAERAASHSFLAESFDALLCSMALMIFPDRARAGGVPPRAAGRRALRGLHQHAAGAVPHRAGPRRRRAARAADAGGARPPLLGLRRGRAARGLGGGGLPGRRGRDGARHFPFPSFDAYFEPSERGGGPWGAEYAALPAEARRAVREEVRQGLERDRATAADGTLEIGVDILFGHGRK